MICKEKFRVLTDEEKTCYIPELCELCCFYDECELINSYFVKQVQKNTTKTIINAKPLSSKKIKEKPTVIAKTPQTMQNEPFGTIKNLPFYMRVFLENEVCPIKRLNQVECGSKWVADGIGDDYKIDIRYDWKKERYVIDKSSRKRGDITGKWEPRQSVYISAMTGNGKNHFIENVLLPYVRYLNHKYQTNLRVLILSNRKALQAQAKDRLNNGIRSQDDEGDVIYPLPGSDYADVMMYQSVLNKSEYLKRVQTQRDSNYIFVICDEPHYFTSDAMFNPDTDRTLSEIVNIFKDAIRVYMTATPYECIPYIREKEAQIDKFLPCVMYHFKRDYSYLNTKCFSELAELSTIIINSVVNSNEKWLIFIDSKKQGGAFKKMLEENNGIATDLKGKVMTIDADSKYKDKNYQQMIVDEKFSKGINVVIATSVIDNGVNFRDIENVVITDINHIKCLQMVGRVRVAKDSRGKYLGKVTLYIKRHNASFFSKRLKAIGVQQDAYHAYDMAGVARNYKWEFLYKYKDSNQEDRENSKHWFGRDKKNPDFLYLNEIARSLADKQAHVYESILEEMAETDKGKKVTGQKYLEYQLSWFGKKYSKKNDITLNGYKNNNRLGFDKWLQEEWLDKKISKEAQKDFGKKFFAKYNPLFGLCTKKQGFATDDNRGENGPKVVGYSIKRIKEIFQVKKMPYEIIENDSYYTVKLRT